MSDTENNETTAPDDAPETTGDGTPVDGIEAAAAAAAVDEPAPAVVEPPAEPDPEPEPAAESTSTKAPATKRTRQTKSKRGKDTAANVEHLAVKKANRPEAPPAAEPTAEETAAVELKIATRARLREIKEEIEALQKDIAVLHDEQAELVNPKLVDDGMTFVERHAQVLARSKEIREQRVKDRLKLLARGAGQSPLDRSLTERPRQSMASADAAADADNTE